MNLSEKERHILSYVHLQGDLSTMKIAQELGYQRHTVRSCLERFSENGLLGRYALINPYALGLNEYAIYFSLIAAKGRRELLQQLVAADNVCLVQEYANEYSHSISFLGDVWRLTAFLRDLCDRVETSIQRQMVALYYSYTQFQRKYLSTLEVPLNELTTEKTDDVVTLDTVDHQILSLLAHEPGIGTAQIARTCKLPPTTVEYRLKKLKARNVYKGNVYIFNPSILGIQMFWFLVTVGDYSSQTFERMRSFCATHPNVTALVQCHGGWQFEIAVELFDSGQLSDIKERLAEALGDALRQVIVLPLVSELKYCLYPFRSVPWFVPAGA